MANPNTKNVSLPDFEGLSRHGLIVFPVPRGEKAPAMKWKHFQQAPPTPEQIQAWQGTETNVAVVTGQQSNLLVIDVDSEESQTFIDKLDLPETPVVRTARGKHYYFRYPAREIRSSVHFEDLALDVRAEGGIVIGPGSLHASGHIYQWEISPDECAFADFPEEAMERMFPKKKSATPALISRDDRYIEAGAFDVWLNREVQDQINILRAAQEGERNNVLFKVAARLANHVAALAIDWCEVADSLRSVALAIGLEAYEIDPTLESAWQRGSKTPTPWIEIARSWIFIASRDRFWSPATRLELTPKAFSMNFADAMPLSKGTLAGYLTQSGVVERVLDFRFEPSQPSGVFEADGEKFFNTYLAPEIKAQPGDWSKLEEFLEYLVPEESERCHLVKMIAWTIANPGKKLSYSLLLQSKEHGVGKSTLIEIWRNLLGYRNTRKTNSEEMNSAYQSYLADTLLVVLEELDLGSGIGVYNRLKDMITGETAIINEKYVKQREVPNYANFVFLSNLDAPLFIEQNDRRFYVLDTPAERRCTGYWTDFQAWWKNNLGILKAYFDAVEISDFQPKAVPPSTPAKDRLKRQSATPLAQALGDLLQERPWPIARGVCTLPEIQTALRNYGFVERNRSRITNALKDMGCIPLKQVRISDGSRPSFWTLFDVEKWETATAAEIREVYERPMVALSIEEAA